MQAAPWATYSSFKPITTSDTVPVNCRAIYVGGAGNVKVTNPDGSTATFTAPPVGSILPIELNNGFVNATGTTATLLVALA